MDCHNPDTVLQGRYIDFLAVLVGKLKQLDNYILRTFPQLTDKIAALQQKLMQHRTDRGIHRQFHNGAYCIAESLFLLVITRYKFRQDRVGGQSLLGQEAIEHLQHQKHLHNLALPEEILLYAERIWNIQTLKGIQNKVHICIFPDQDSPLPIILLACCGNGTGNEEGLLLPHQSILLSCGQFLEVILLVPESNHIDNWPCGFRTPWNAEFRLLGILAGVGDDPVFLHQVLGKISVVEIYNLLNRPEVVLESDIEHGILVPVLLEDLIVALLEPVDRLLKVSHHKQMIILIMERVQNLFLKPVGILELIHHNVLKLILYLFKNPIVLQKGDKVQMII